MHNEHPQKLEPALYVVATPIGNLRDITLRALDVLAAADVLAAEDTRNTAHLLTHYGISANRLIAVHQHNERGAAEKIIALLQAGQSVAFVSDAGTPAVSDPGALLLQAVRTAGLRVIPIPGPSAAIAALSSSGLNDPHFYFYGFLPNKSAARRTALRSLISYPCTLVFYEAPHRIVECVLRLHVSVSMVNRSRKKVRFFADIAIFDLKSGTFDFIDAEGNNLKGDTCLVPCHTIRRGKTVWQDV